MNPTRLRRATANGRRDAAARAKRRRASERGDAITVTLGYRAAVRRRRRCSPSSRSARSPASRSSTASSIRRSVRAGVDRHRSARLARGALPAATRRASRSRSPPRSARRAAPSSPPCAAGSTSTPRPRRSTRRSPSLPGDAGLRLPGSVDALRARRARRARPAGHGRGGADARAPPGRALRQPTRDALGATSIARFPAPGRCSPPRRSSGSPSSASSAAAPARSRRSRANWIDARAAARAAAAIPGAARRAAARAAGHRRRGPRTTSRCARLGWPDAFPPGDVAALKAMQRAVRDVLAARGRGARRGLAAVAQLRAAATLEFPFVEITP